VDPRNEKNLLYEPDNERRGWGLVMVLTALVVRRLLMVMIYIIGIKEKITLREKDN
jgi:hypothetical protein